MVQTVIAALEAEAGRLNSMPTWITMSSKSSLHNLMRRNFKFHLMSKRKVTEQKSSCGSDHFPRVRQALGQSVSSKTHLCASYFSNKFSIRPMSPFRKQPISFRNFPGKGCLHSEPPQPHGKPSLRLQIWLFFVFLRWVSQSRLVLTLPPKSWDYRHQLPHLA